MANRCHRRVETNSSARHTSVDTAGDSYCPTEVDGWSHQSVAFWKTWARPRPPSAGDRCIRCFWRRRRYGLSPTRQNRLFLSGCCSPRRWRETAVTQHERKSKRGQSRGDISSEVRTHRNVLAASSSQSVISLMASFSLACCVVRSLVLSAVALTLVSLFLPSDTTV